MKHIEQERMPIFEALQNYVNEGTIPFHVPGHKQGRGNELLKEILSKNALAMDLTCMEDLDNICNPKGVIQEAEELAAQAFGADNAFFLVNGTTSGIQAMILSVCNPGDKIILPRNAHKSAIGGIILSGAHPIYVDPEIDPFLGVALGVSPRKIQDAIDKNPDAKGVFVINPTYYGVGSNLEEIIKISHENKIPVLVDEAHGAHFHFHRELPKSAMELGADLVSSSTHKLLGSLTQSSMLLHKGELIDPKHIKAVLNLTQTTSPSYILLASLDIARRNIALNGESLIAETIRLSKYAKKEIASIEGLYVLENDILDGDGKYFVDPTKLTINVRELGFSGYDVERILRHEYNIQVELSDLYNIIALVTLGDSIETIDILLGALREIAEKRIKTNIVKYSASLPILPQQIVLPKEAFYSKTRLLPLDEAEGEISAEMIMAYPPGIPIICPGEQLTKEIIDYIKILASEEAQLQGTEDPDVKNIKVLDKNIEFINTNMVSIVG